MSRPPRTTRDVELIFEDLRREGHMELRVDPETGELLGRLTDAGREKAEAIIKRMLSLPENTSSERVQEAVIRLFGSSP